MLPDGWTETKLEKVIKLGSGETKPADTSDNGTKDRPYPVYGGNGVLGYSSQCNVETPIIVIGRVGAYCGVTRYVDTPCWITDNALMTKKVAEGYEKKFLTYKLQNFDLSRLRKKGGQPLVSQGPIYNQELSFPPFYEQQAVVKILESSDRLIEELQLFIEQKQKQKKALMQRLLTGKHRFSEFKGQKWKTYKLSDFLIPTFRDVDKPSENYLAIGVRSHCKGTFQKPDSEPDKIAMKTLYVVKKDDLIVNITFAWEGAIALVKAEDEGGLVSHRFPTYTFKTDRAIPEFFKYVITTKRFRYILDLISPGGAGRNRVLSKKEFVKIEWLMPSVEEQQKIAAVLNAADKEIDLLTQKLEAYQDQKKGLMQQLLTGKKRVNLKNKEAA